ncbi:hypothetical protein BLSMQ_1775 [Brevibacterium aurantiacum]|uniref:Uncharacterized protein n=1 Tax=Brevibacterium aurantiacum TaxID=273384 RepID=A0A1D7W3E4_BREAU|nr:hypothetical protein BLSMQ_1775 [Brevibacterium aurantiacum]
MRFTRLVKGVNEFGHSNLRLSVVHVQVPIGPVADHPCSAAAE